MSEKKILRVEVTKNDKIVIGCEETNENGYGFNWNGTCAEPAAPSFYDAIKALSIHATALCELPESYAKRLSVKTIKFTYKGDNEIMGAKMLVVVDMFHSEGAVSYWTPHKPSVPYDENAKEPYGDKALTEGCVNALWEVVRQAQLYINGERSQITLDFEQAAESAEPIEEDIPPEEEQDEMIEDIPLDTNIVNFPAANPVLGTHAAL